MQYDPFYDLMGHGLPVCYKKLKFKRCSFSAYEITFTVADSAGRVQ